MPSLPTRCPLCLSPHWFYTGYGTNKIGHCPQCDHHVALPIQPVRPLGQNSLLDDENRPRPPFPGYEPVPDPEGTTYEEVELNPEKEDDDPEE